MSETWRTFGMTLIVLLSIACGLFIFSYLSRECNSHSDCQQNEVCTVHHTCISRGKTTYTNILSSLIVGISLIGTALILKGNTSKNKGEKDNESITDKTPHSKKWHSRIKFLFSSKKKKEEKTESDDKRNE